MAKAVTGSTRENVESLFVPIRRSTIPVTGRGIVAGPPRVRIGDNGQVSFSSKAAEVLADCRVVYAWYNPQNKQLKIKGYATVPETLKPTVFGEGASADDFFALAKGKAKGTYFSGAGLLRSIDFDYSTAAHLWDEGKGMTVTADKQTFIIDLSAGVKAEKVARKSRRADTAPATTSPVAETETEEEEDEELELEESEEQ